MGRLKDIILNPDLIPRSQGYYFPAEWTQHRATWVTLPLNDGSWPGMMNTVYDAFFRFIQIISLSEIVAINVQNEIMAAFVDDMLNNYRIDPAKIELYLHPTNDCWARDHGPGFLKNKQGEKILLNWKFNAWGRKYAYDLDDLIPVRIGEALQLPVIDVGIVMEGGAVEFNGAGSLLTTRSCLLNPNRNPHLSAIEIENYLMNYYGVEKVLWLEDGIAGDDTDGHIDDIARFVKEDTVLAMIEKDKSDPNFQPLKTNRKLLSEFRLPGGKQLNIIELPMPPPVCYNDERLPASYANFYMTNGHVIVPVFQADTDDTAIEIISRCFPTREVTGIDSRVLIHGLGSFHCLSQQEPA
ncbi:MAG: agmatine deiminase family protein [Cyclobacteriaceae bacterium]|nr:agmatine deiminase family protein [Cyclobacteriaceae bacterium]